MEPGNRGGRPRTQAHLELGQPQSGHARELGGFCYHAARGFLDHLQGELGDHDRVDGELVTVLGERRRAWWTRNQSVNYIASFGKPSA